MRLSLAGAQPKLPVVIDDGQVALPLNAVTPTTHILKPEPEHFPGLVANEAFCMRLARAAMLPVAHVETAVTITGLPYLIVERYDRDLTSDPIRRLHQEDVCQALGIPADSKYQAEGGPSVRETVELLRRATGVPAHELPRLWEALVFNWLIGNCDAHGKNFSLLYDAGAPTLAPLYDLVSTTVVRRPDDPAGDAHRRRDARSSRSTWTRGCDWLPRSGCARASRERPRRPSSSV